MKTSANSEISYVGCSTVLHNMTIIFNVFFRMIKNGSHKKEEVWNLLFHPRWLQLLFSTTNGAQHLKFQNTQKIHE